MLRQDQWTGFPSGIEQIAIEIALSKKEIESRYGLKLIHGSDSLGPCHSTYFNDDLLDSVSIICYENSPHGRAFVYIDAGLDLANAVPRLLHVFQLKPGLTNVPATFD